MLAVPLLAFFSRDLSIISKHRQLTDKRGQCKNAIVRQVAVRFPSVGFACASADGGSLPLQMCRWVGPMQLDRYHRCWFAVQVKSCREKMTAVLLHDKGYEEFLPLYTGSRKRSAQAGGTELPLFPGYLFCRFDSDISAPIVTTPGVIRIVGTGHTPVPITEAEIAAIQAIVKSGFHREPWPFAQVGEVVRIDEGPLSGLQGVLISVGDGHRLIVSVTLLQRAVAVEMDRRWVTPVTQTLGRHTAVRCIASLPGGL